MDGEVLDRRLLAKIEQLRKVSAEKGPAES
jgi:hypothetical protein